LTEGVSLSRYKALSGKPLESQRMQNLLDLGMIEKNRDQLRVLPQGRMVLNSVLAELLVD
jgi:oxygen-independent coproporphyrinogen-3 oxidase